MKKVLALILSLAMLLCLGACAPMEKVAEKAMEELESYESAMTERVEAMLACCRAGDEAGAYALLYPGTMEAEAYHAVFGQLGDYCPITEPCTLSLESFSSSSNLIGRTTVSAEYQAEYGEGTYYILAVYVTDGKGSGFRQFRILSEADYEAAKSFPFSR